MTGSVSRCRRSTVTLVLFLLLLLLAAGAPASAQTGSDSAGSAPAAEARSPEPSDLLGSVASGKPHLSPDGRSVVVRTRRADLGENRYRIRAWRIPTDTAGGRSPLDLPERARDLAWLPDGRRIAFLAPAEGGPQVWVRPIAADSARQVTDREGGVRSFSFSPDGEKLAYTVAREHSTSDAEPSDARRGVVLDMGSFRARELRSDRLAEQVRTSISSTTQLWIEGLATGTATRVADSVSVETFRWGPSGDRLAVTGVPVGWTLEWPDGRPRFRTDLYLYDVPGRRLQRLRKGHQDATDPWKEAVSYSDPFWSPSGDRIGFLRTDESDRFGSVGELGIYDLADGTSRAVTSAETLELDTPNFHWIAPDTLLVEFTRRANRGLYRLSLEDGRTTPVWAPDADAAGFSFDADARRVVWMEEAVDRPPELYTDRRPLDAARRISSLNASLADLWLPETESIEWTSTDGTTVQGWLIRPGERAHADPPPLLVHVHGGPGAVSTNAFVRYPGWPFPVQVYAARGYAVFIPNYRQTDSFGRDFQRISGLDAEPVDDILTGIEHLVAEGEADADRIGITGYSWGGRLAPLAAAEKPIFRAASIAEGVGLNTLSKYGQGSGWSAVGVREYYLGSEPYDQPGRYLEQSPVFREQFVGTTPTLLEYGQTGQVLQGLELGRALWRHGTPHEFVVYPGTGHGFRAPAVRAESMERNLRWFERWIPADSTPTGEPGDDEPAERRP